MRFGATTERHVLPAKQANGPPTPPVREMSSETAERHARYEQSLSPEDRALLRELERKRLAYVDESDAVGVGPGGRDAMSSEATSCSARELDDDRSASETPEASRGDESLRVPCKRRKKELVA
jgi:hypothetical protein